MSPDQTIPIAPYPTRSKQAAALIDGVLTDVMVSSFSDKIMITVTQNGRLAQWIQVPLDSFASGLADTRLPMGSDEEEFSPLTHLTPKTLLGGSNMERETIGQLYATQIAGAIISKNPDENRTILVGLGLSKVEATRENFFDLLDLIVHCL